MGDARPNYWIKGAITPEEEFWIAATNGEILYLLTYATEPLIARDSNITVHADETPVLVFDPRPLADLGRVAQARLLNMEGTQAQILLSNSPNETLHAVGVERSVDGDSLVAAPSVEPETFAFLDQFGIGVNEIRAEGRYFLKEYDGAEGQAIEWYRFLPISSRGTAERAAVTGIQRTTRNLPYVEASGSLRLTLIPIRLFSEAGAVVTGQPLLGHAKDFASRSAAQPPRLYTSKEEAARGWYTVCRKGQRCGSCYGSCPGGATCTVTYDRGKRKISYRCGFAPDLEKEVEWYENWWVLTLIVVVILVVMVILLMLALAHSSSRNDRD